MKRLMILLICFCFFTHLSAQRYFISEKSNITQYWELDSLSAIGFDLGKEITKVEYEAMQSAEEKKMFEITQPVELSPIQKEIEGLRNLAPNATFIFKRYNLTNSNKNGYSLREIYEAMGFDHFNLSKKDISYAIYNSL